MCSTPTLQVNISFPLLLKLPFYSGPNVKDCSLLLYCGILDLIIDDLFVYSITNVIIV